jgi:putative ABC transport system substrate-binding protein
MRRREFISLLVGGTVSWPHIVRAQQSEQTRRIGVLMAQAPNDPVGITRIEAFQRTLQQLGWTEGRNLRTDVRWSADQADDTRKYAAQLVELAPDVILGSGTLAAIALQQATRAVPVVFTLVADPVGAGMVNSLARPGGNATGFISLEYGMSGKWLELLKEIAPGITRVAVLRDLLSAGIGQFGAIQNAAPSFGMEVSPINVSDPEEIKRAVETFASTPNGGLIVTGSTSSATHRDLIIMLAARHKLPAVFSNRYFIADGGLISYGPDFVDQFRRAAGYVDRILRGEKPADLPVQTPTKYQLVINRNTAKALGLNVPQTLQASADEVID